MRVLVLVAVAALAALGARFASPEVLFSPEAASASEGTVAGSAAAGGEVLSPVYTIIDVNTYELVGASEEVLLAGMRALGPKSEGSEYFGLTETQLAYRYWKEEAEDGCHLEQIRIDLNVTITLPRWEASRVAPYELRRDWLRFDTALRRHEDGHRQISEQSAREVYHALRSLRTASCDGMDVAAQRTAERLRDVSEQRQANYDRQTGHGRTQGAVWPQSARRHSMG